MSTLFAPASLSLQAWQQYWYEALHNGRSTTQYALMLAHAHWQQQTQNADYIRALADVFSLAAESIQLRLPKDILPLDFDIAANLHAPQANNSAEVLHLATLFLLAALKIPVAKTGDYGYNYRIASSDILEYCGLAFAQNEAQANQQLQKFSFTYLHLPHFYPYLSKLRQARQEFALPSIIDQISPLLEPTTNSSHHIIGCPTATQARTFRHFLSSDSHRALLYDTTNAPMISLCGDFFWQNSPDIEAMRLSDWQLPQLNDNILYQQNANNTADCAQLLRQILDNQISSDWATLLITNTAFIAQTIQPQRSISRTLLDAEAALSARHALHILEQLCGKIAPNPSK
jgi:anthranilate phosphoribosyltransferase